MIKEMKKTAYEIYEEEKKEHNLEGSFIPMTLIEYYNYNIFEQKLKLFKEHKHPILLSGITGIHTKDNIFIFLKYSNILKRPSLRHLDFIETCYHEIRHEQQKQFNQYNYHGFLYQLEHFVAAMDYDDYYENPSKYSFEIGANLYGITKTEQYIKEKYKELYPKVAKEIELRKKEYLIDYMLYDASSMFDLFVKLMQEKLNKSKEKRVTNLNDYTILSTFLNDDLSIKKISEIINSEYYHKFDDKIIYVVLSSKTFLENTNINELSNEELLLLSKSLKYTHTIYHNQIEWLKQDKKLSSYDKWKKLKKHRSKLDEINNYMLKIIGQMLNNDDTKIKR